VQSTIECLNSLVKQGYVLISTGFLLWCRPDLLVTICSRQR